MIIIHILKISGDLLIQQIIQIYHYGADMLPGAIGSTSETNQNLSTRLFIGENYRYDVIFYPAILVKSGR